jgi:hypothetical protein
MRVGSSIQKFEQARKKGDLRLMSEDHRKRGSQEAYLSIMRVVENVIRILENDLDKLGTCVVDLKLLKRRLLKLRP